MSIQHEEPAAGEEGSPALTAKEVPSSRVVGPGLWAFIVLLALVGGAAILLAAGVAALFALVRAGDPGLNLAVDRLTAAAEKLPGVRSVDVEPGLGDLGTTPVDLYGDVRLNGTCTLSTLTTTTVRLRAIMAREETFQWHPTVWCHHQGLTVSPLSAVTKQRLAVVSQLMRDPALSAAAAIVRQRGDDPSPDFDNEWLLVQLYVPARTSGTVARTWLAQLRASLPSVTVTATTGRPGDYFDSFSLQSGQWAVVVQAGDSMAETILRSAMRMEQDPMVKGGYFDTPGRQIAVVVSDPASLRDLEPTLRAPTHEEGDQAFRLTVTLEARKHRARLVQPPSASSTETAPTVTQSNRTLGGSGCVVGIT